MTTTTLKRQFITDEEGNPIAVILPLEEFALVKDILDRRSQATDEADKLAQIEQAAQDPLFMTCARQCRHSLRPTPNGGNQLNEGSVAHFLRRA